MTDSFIINLRRMAEPRYHIIALWNAWRIRQRVLQWDIPISKKIEWFKASRQIGYLCTIGRRLTFNDEQHYVLLTVK